MLVSCSVGLSAFFWKLSCVFFLQFDLRLLPKSLLFGMLLQESFTTCNL